MELDESFCYMFFSPFGPHPLADVNSSNPLPKGAVAFSARQDTEERVLEDVMVSTGDVDMACSFCRRLISY